MAEAKKGYVIVIEGTDGSGKGTQIKPLADYLAKISFPYEVIDFPRYTQNPYGVIVGRYLAGDYGGIHQVHPEIAALPYANDRLLAKPLIEGWLDEGKIVLANRYTPSNLAFQAAKLPQQERPAFINWLESLEYGTNGIPREDLVLLLNVTPDIGQQNVDRKGHRGYVGGERRDIHEADLAYQQEVVKTYLWMASQKPHWRVIDCMENGGMLPPDVINSRILDILANKHPAFGDPKQIPQPRLFL